MGFDITKYAALLLKAYELEERLRGRAKELRENPPKNVTEYMALVNEVQSLTVELQALWAEIRALLDSGKVTPGDIEAAHLRNQQAWTVKEEDRSSVVYTTIDSAIAALGGEFVFVLEMEDGTFRIWPMIGPLPGKKVYPV